MWPKVDSELDSWLQILQREFRLQKVPNKLEGGTCICSGYGGGIVKVLQTSGTFILYVPSLMTGLMQWTHLM